MSIDRSGVSRIPKHQDATQSTGTLVLPGTYLAVVKNAADANRTGRLVVWIPVLGGAEDDDANWITVRYASPFLGSTATPTRRDVNDWASSSQTYGFWAVPPDVGNQVLVTFVTGDKNKGFWFACVFDREGHAMMPGNPGGAPGTDFDINSVNSPTLKSTIRKTKDANVPLSESNRFAKFGEPLVNRKKTVHEFLASTYIQQGLETDIVRGAGRSSSQRDIPSSVVGISTPGRPLNDAATATNTPDKNIYGRQGGHSFTMDDGDYFGQSQGMRMRTAGGHQILMDDTSGTFYVINKSGSCWIELSNTGQMSVYSGGGVNFRTRGDFNIHSDRFINIYGENGINMYTNGTFKIEGKDEVGITGGGRLCLFGDQDLVLLSQKGGLKVEVQGRVSFNAEGDIILDTADSKSVGIQVGKAAKGQKPTRGITLYDHDDTENTGVTWARRPRVLQSCTPVLPTHEPWNREGYDIFTNQSKNVTEGPAPVQKFTGNNTRIGSLFNAEIPDIGGALSEEFLAKWPGVSVGIGRTIGSEYLPKTNSFTSLSAPRAGNAVGSLDTAKLGSLQASIAFLETRGDPNRTAADYKTLDADRRAGRYQHKVEDLERLGYIAPGSSALYGSRAYDRNDVWTGKNGIQNGRDYLESPGEQERAQVSLTERNYRQLEASGVVSRESPPEHVAGMLAVAHGLGPSKAVAWARTGDGRNNTGIDGATYYAAASYSVQNRVKY
jgi:hypothetical protein